MLILHSLGGPTFRCTAAGSTLLVFPEEGTTPPQGGVMLLSVPQEDPAPGVLSWPGEYDAAGFSIRGIGQDEGRQVSYLVHVEGIRCAFLSSPLGSWSEQEMTALGDVDLLVLPAEGEKVVGAIVEEVDPRVVVPLSTKDGAHFSAVLSLLGGAGSAPVSELKLKAGSLPQESRVVVVLESQGGKAAAKGKKK